MLLDPDNNTWLGWGCRLDTCWFSHPVPEVWLVRKMTETRGMGSNAFSLTVKDLGLSCPLAPRYSWDFMLLLKRPLLLLSVLITLQTGSSGVDCTHSLKLAKISVVPESVWFATSFCLARQLIKLSFNNYISYSIIIIILAIIITNTAESFQKVQCQTL